MKKMTLQIETEAEKVGAIRLYLDGKDGNLEKELSEYVDTLYKKYVPAQVREFIEKTDAQETTSKKPSRRTSQNKAVCGENETNRADTRENG